MSETESQQDAPLVGPVSELTEAELLDESVIGSALELLQRSDEGKEIALRLKAFADKSIALQREAVRREHDFDTLFEMVREVSVRTLDAHRLQLYLLRTLMGRFVVWKVVIFRHAESGRHFEVVAARGLGPHRESAEEGLTIALDSDFTDMLLNRDDVLDLSATDFVDIAESRWLREIGIDTILPLVAREEAGEASLEGFIGFGPRLGDRPFRSSDLRLLNMLGRVIAVSYRNELLFRRSIYDDLTQVASRGYFDARLSDEIAKRERDEHKGAALLMLDLDHFKEFNDRWGHQAGDVALRRVASAARSCVRSGDLVARYGGEEFAVILVEINSREDATQAAERIRRAIKSRLVAEKNGKSLMITSSIGVAYYPEDAQTAHNLIAAADQALYRAKALGRDRSCSAESIRKE